MKGRSSGKRTGMYIPCFKYIWRKRCPSSDQHLGYLHWRRQGRNIDLRIPGSRLNTSYLVRTSGFVLEQMATRLDPDPRYAFTVGSEMWSRRLPDALWTAWRTLACRAMINNSDAHTYAMRSAWVNGCERLTQYSCTNVQGLLIPVSGSRQKSDPLAGQSKGQAGQTPYVISPQYRLRQVLGRQGNRQTQERQN